MEKECDGTCVLYAQIRASEIEKRKLLSENILKMGRHDRIPD